MTYSSDVTRIIDQLSDQPVAYHPDLARAVGSVKAALFLGQLLYWNGKGVRKDGWIWKTVAEMEGETALTRSEQEGARTKLEQAGVLEAKRMGAFGRLHYRLDLSALQQKLQTCLGKTAKQEKPEAGRLPEIPIQENPESSLQKTDKQPGTAFAENLQTISENTTSENTTESTSLPVADKKRQPTGRNLIKKQLEDYFAKVSGIPLPALKTARDRKAAGERWWKPLLYIASLVNDDIPQAQKLIDTALRQLDDNNYTVSAPASIQNTAASLHGQQVRRGGNGPSRILKVA